jgi:hypothetical protein
VAATPDRVLGFAVFYPDASVQESGFPSGWAGVRVLAVYPGAGDADVTRALLGACERLAAEAGAVSSVAQIRYVAQMYMNLIR